MEYGVLSEYEETWEQLPSSVGEQAAFRLKGPDERPGALLIAGTYFMFAADRPQPLAATGAVPGQLQAEDGEVMDKAMQAASAQLLASMQPCWHPALQTQIQLHTTINADVVLPALQGWRYGMRYSICSQSSKGLH